MDGVHFGSYVCDIALGPERTIAHGWVSEARDVLPLLGVSGATSLCGSEENGKTGVCARLYLRVGAFFDMPLVDISRYLSLWWFFARSFLPDSSAALLHNGCISRSIRPSGAKI